MLVSIYHMTLKLLKNGIFEWKRMIMPAFMQQQNGSHCVNLVVYRFQHHSLKILIVPLKYQNLPK